MVGKEGFLRVIIIVFFGRKFAERKSKEAAVGSFCAFGEMERQRVIRYDDTPFPHHLTSFPSTQIPTIHTSISHNSRSYNSIFIITSLPPVYPLSFPIIFSSSNIIVISSSESNLSTT